MERERTHETGAHVGKNVTVQVGRDEDRVGERVGVLADAEADPVEEVLVVGDVGVVLGDGAAGLEEHAVRHLHDGRLVDGGDPVAAADLGVVEGVPGDTLRGVMRDELDRLNDAGDELVLDARVLALSVLTDEDRVDVVVGRLEALDRRARPNVGKEVERPAERQVERDVALADGRREWALERDRVLLDRGDGVVGDLRLTVDDDRGDLDLLPLDGRLSLRKDLLDRLGNLRANACIGDRWASGCLLSACDSTKAAMQAGRTVSGDEGDGVVALKMRCKEG